MTSARCVDCERGLDHCHAVWIRHLDGHEECVVASCHLADDAHVFIVSCTDVDPGCCS